MKITKPTRVTYEGELGTIVGFDIEGEADFDYIFSYDNKCKGHDGINDDYQFFEGVKRVPTGYYFVGHSEITILKESSVEDQIADLEEQIRILKHIPKHGEIVVAWNYHEKIIGVLNEIVDGHYRIAEEWYDNAVTYEVTKTVEEQLR